jgi:hypothetical protein
VARRTYQKKVRKILPQMCSYRSLIRASAGSRSNTKAIGGESLATRLVGVHMEGYGFHGYWVYPFFNSDSNLTCTLLLDILTMSAKRRGGILPPVLFLQMDNCGRENKNHTVIAFLAILIELKVFKEIYLTFLPVGHTHCKVDQRFSRISVHLKPKDLPTLDHMMDSVKGSTHACSRLATSLLSETTLLFVELKFSKNEIATHELVKRVHDWKQWMGLRMNVQDDQRLVETFHGLGTCRVHGTKRRMHSFKVCMNESNTHVVLLYKEWDQSGPWRSHWSGNTSQKLRILKEGTIIHCRRL